MRALRCARLGLHFAWGALTVACAYPFLGDTARLWLKRRWSAQLLDILNVRLVGHPSAMTGDKPPETSGGRLFVANHVSWLDIFALNAVRPMAFIAKSEIRGWPLAGWLAYRTDTLFLQRGRYGPMQATNRRIAKLLAMGKDVALFPEGTTSDGSGVLAFHSALLQPAIDGRHAIQPMSIGYFDEDGHPSAAPVYAGDTSLGACLVAILACRSLSVRLRPTPPLIPSGTPVGNERRALATTARGAIVYALGLSTPDSLETAGSSLRRAPSGHPRAGTTPSPG